MEEAGNKNILNLPSSGILANLTNLKEVPNSSVTAVDIKEAIGLFNGISLEEKLIAKVEEVAIANRGAVDWRGRTVLKDKKLRGGKMMSRDLKLPRLRVQMKKKPKPAFSRLLPTFSIGGWGANKHGRIHRGYLVYDKLHKFWSSTENISKGMMKRPLNRWRVVGQSLRPWVSLNNLTIKTYVEPSNVENAPKMPTSCDSTMDVDAPKSLSGSVTALDKNV